MQSDNGKPLVGLIMSGGGARGAYQVGVLKAIASILPPKTPNPFPIICGTSAGAINATALAIYARRFQIGVRRLEHVWRNFQVDHIYRADAVGVIQTGARWLAALMFGGLGRSNPYSLLDRSPLNKLLGNWLPCDEIQRSIDAGALRALSISCSGYDSGQSVAFYQGVDGLVPWRRARRIGCPMNITVDHLMASSAIPFLFAPIKIHREYFGDGSMRQVAPISPALHLGADKVLVIGVRKEVNGDVDREESDGFPSLGQVAGHVLNSIFLDSLEADLERLNRINKTISLIPASYLHEGKITLRKVDVLVISPSEDLEQIAAKHIYSLPRPVRYLLRGLGAFNRRGSNLASYLLFERPYCRALIGLGYADAMYRRKEILEFLGMAESYQAEPLEYPEERNNVA